MAQQNFGSPRIIPLLLLLGIALPVAAQKAAPKKPEAAKDPHKLSDDEIALLREKRAKAVWLQHFIANHESQMDIGSSFALTPNPCDDFEKDNPSLPDAKTFCIESRTLYTTIQKDMKTGTDNLPGGWPEEVEAAEKRIPDYGATPKVFVRDIVNGHDPEFDKIAASVIGRFIDLSQGRISQQNIVVLSGMNLIDTVQEPGAGALPKRLLDYMVRESCPPAGKTDAVRQAIKPWVDKAVTFVRFDWLYMTLAMQQGLHSNEGLSLFKASDGEETLNQNLGKAKAAATSVIQGENSLVTPPTPSPNASGATAAP